MPKDRRTDEQIAERDVRRAADTAAREIRREAATAAREARRAVYSAVYAEAKGKRTTGKMKKKSAAYIKREKKKLEREEDRRLKNRDEREINRLEVRTAGVEERQQHTINVQSAKERDWEAYREGERQKKIKGDEVVRQIEAAKVKK